MKKLLLFVFLVPFLLQAQQENIELAPNCQIDQTIAARDTFELFFSFPTIAYIGEYGAETDGDYIYSTQWLDDSLARYELTGNIIERFVITGVGHVRDMAYDEQYFYGSPNDFFFYVLDLDNKTLISTHQTSFRIRGMAYDPIEDVLWASEHWTPMFYKLDKQG
ncbi:MAG: hypothetical protein KKA81_07270, partial [Bacteroidetes bacterium]|nr:hypothetical protein [Bacteroidota bacterium]